MGEDVEHCFRQTQTFVVMGVFPSLNEYISEERKGRMGRFAANRMKREWMDIVEGYINLARLETICGPCVLGFKWYERNKKRDVDNVRAFATKVILDALVERGILPNDTQRWVRGLSDEFYVDEGNPRVVVTIKELEGV